MRPPRFPVHKRAVKRLDTGHPWVFANELAVPARELPEGGTVDITAPDGRFLGRGYANPHALVAVRLCTRDKAQHIDLPGFWAARIRDAVAHRRTLLGPVAAFRLVHGEADGLPGLEIDRYGPVAVARLLTRGVEARADAILEALLDVLPDLEGVLRRDDARDRELEGLPRQVSVWSGEVPEHLDVDMDGTLLRVDPRTGPRTGLFLDARSDRRAAAPLFAGRRVLDVYAGGGAWGLSALGAGATEVVCVEKVEARCAEIQVNAGLNGVADRVDIIQDEARRTLMALGAASERFGVVVLDPPPFARTRKAAGSGLRGYRELHALAFALVTPGGFLLTTERSRVIFEDRFLEAVIQGARDAGVALRQVRRGEPSPDHPVRPVLPESRTLTHLAFQVLPPW